MNDSKIIKKKKKKINIYHIVGIQLIVFLAIGIYLYANDVAREKETYENEQTVIESTIRNNATQYLFVLESLQTYYDIYKEEELTIENLNKFVSDEEKSRLGIEFISISPENMTELVFPESESEGIIGEDVTVLYEPYLLGLYYRAINQNVPLVTQKLATYNDKKVIVFAIPIHNDDNDWGIINLYVDYDVYYRINIGIFNSDILDVSLYDINHRLLVGSFEHDDADYIYKQLGTEQNMIYMGANISAQYNQHVHLIRFIQMGLLVLVMIATTVSTILTSNKRKEFIERLEYIGFHDKVTNLPNENQLIEDIQFLIMNQKKFHLSIGILDNLKYVVNHFQQSLGDKALVQIAEELNMYKTEQMVLYKLNMDTFALLSLDEDMLSLINVVNEAIYYVSKPVMIDKSSYKLSMKFGIVSYPDNGDNYIELKKKANSVIVNLDYVNNGFMAVYGDIFRENEMTPFDIDNLVKKMDVNDFKVNLQPIVNVETGKIVGFELLSRPYNKITKTIPIQQAVQSLEHSGRIAELDYYVLRKMFRYLKHLQRIEDSIFLSINISPYSINTALAEFIKHEIGRLKINPYDIVLEILESRELLDNKKALDTIKAIAAMGCRISIDDFGTGYSSLSSISMVPLSFLKIDKKYVQSDVKNAFDQEMLKTLILLGSKLNFDVIAEGVETKVQLNNIMKKKYKYYQGFYYSRAVSLNQAKMMLIKSKNELK